VSEGFTAAELQLTYNAWSKLLTRKRVSELAPEVLVWLGYWNIWDLACSPMDDAERRHIRYGHYLGYF